MSPTCNDGSSLDKLIHLQCVVHRYSVRTCSTDVEKLDLIEILYMYSVKALFDALLGSCAIVSSTSWGKRNYIFTAAILFNISVLLMRALFQ